MLRSTITGGTLIAQSTRRADGRADATDDEHHQGEVVEAARPRREALRTARLLVRAPARAAPERQAGCRRRGHGQEAPAAPDAVARAERRQARHTGPPGSLAGARGPCAAGARAQIGHPAAAAGPRRADQAARGAAGEPGRERAAAFLARRVVPVR